MERKIYFPGKEWGGWLDSTIYIYTHIYIPTYYLLYYIWDQGNVASAAMNGGGEGDVKEEPIENVDPAAAASNPMLMYQQLPVEYQHQIFAMMQNQFAPGIYMFNFLIAIPPWCMWRKA